MSGWLTRFAERHGDLTCDAAPQRVVVHASDGSAATLDVPFPPLAVDLDAPFGGLLAHLTCRRRVGVLLVRLGGAAVGIAETGLADSGASTTRLVASKIERRHVQGRSAAGGWSQQRFARRREGQAKQAYAAAAEASVRLLLPAVATLDALVLGGDRRAVDAVLADPRLRALPSLVTGPLLDVVDPRQKVLEDALPRLDAVRLTVEEPVRPNG